MERQSHRVCNSSWRNAKCETTTVNFWSCQLFSWVEHLRVESGFNTQEQFIVPDGWLEPFILLEDVAIPQTISAVAAWIQKITKVVLSLTSQTNEKHLSEVCLFMTGVYIKYWFQSPSSASAPRDDLNLLYTLSDCPNRKVAEAATTAFGRHLSDLSELLIGFAFFDDDVSIEEKRLMVMALIDTKGSDEPPKRISLFVSPETKRLHDFVTTSTRLFFPDPRLIRRILKG